MELIQLAIKKWMPSATTLTFNDEEEVWGELISAEPNLLLIRLSGTELLRRLRARKVKYPIVLVKTFVNTTVEQEIRHIAGPTLNITLLPLKENFLEVLHRMIEELR